MTSSSSSSSFLMNGNVGDSTLDIFGIYARDSIDQKAKFPNFDSKREEVGETSSSSLLSLLHTTGNSSGSNSSSNNKKIEIRYDYHVQSVGRLDTFILSSTRNKTLEEHLVRYKDVMKTNCLLVYTLTEQQEEWFNLFALLVYPKYIRGGGRVTTRVQMAHGQGWVTVHMMDGKDNTRFVSLELNELKCNFGYHCNGPLRSSFPLKWYEEEEEEETVSSVNPEVKTKQVSLTQRHIAHIQHRSRGSDGPWKWEVVHKYCIGLTEECDCENPLVVRCNHCHSYYCPNCIITCEAEQDCISINVRVTECALPVAVPSSCDKDKEYLLPCTRVNEQRQLDPNGSRFALRRIQTKKNVSSSFIKQEQADNLVKRRKLISIITPNCLYIDQALGTLHTSNQKMDSCPKCHGCKSSSSSSST